MLQGILVLSLGKLVLLFAELDVALVLLVRGDLDKLDVAHHPPLRLSVLDLHQFDVEDESCLGWDCRRAPPSTVTVLVLDRKLGLLTKAHAHDANVPTLDHLPHANVDLEGFLVDAAIKHGAVSEATSVVHQHFLTLLGLVTLVTHFQDLLDHSTIVCQVDHITDLLLGDFSTAGSCYFFNHCLCEGVF